MDLCVPKNRKVRCKAYLEWLRTQPCIVCGRQPSEYLSVMAAHQNLTKNAKGISTKVDDTWALPVCTECHRREHNAGVKTFWKDADIKILAITTMTKFISEKFK